MSLRDTIANADDISEELVDVPEWGVKLLVVSPSVAERNRLLGMYPNGEDAEVDLDLVTFSTIVATCKDPETREAVFTEADKEMILSKSGEVVGRLLERCQKAIGFDSKQVVEEKKGG